MGSLVECVSLAGGSTCVLAGRSVCRCGVHAGTVSTLATRFVAWRTSVVVEICPDGGCAGPVLCCFVVRAVGRGAPRAQRPDGSCSGIHQGFSTCDRSGAKSALSTSAKPGANGGEQGLDSGRRAEGTRHRYRSSCSHCQ